MNKPEYLEKEINAMNILENEESDLDSSRLENLHCGAPVLNVGLL